MESVAQMEGWRVPVYRCLGYGCLGTHPGDPLGYPPGYRGIPPGVPLGGSPGGPLWDTPGGPLPPPWVPQWLPGGMPGGIPRGVFFNCFWKDLLQVGGGWTPVASSFYSSYFPAWCKRYPSYRGGGGGRQVLPLHLPRGARGTPLTGGGGNTQARKLSQIN